MPTPGLRHRALLLATLCCGSPGAFADESPLPYRVEVAVSWGSPGGPESLRARLESEIVARIRQARCFDLTVPRGTDLAGVPDLRLAVVVDDYHEETEFDYAISDRAGPDSGRARRSASRVAGDFEATVMLNEDGAIVRQRRFRRESTWRPLWQEDPRQAAQDQLVEDVARAVRKLACKGSPAKWGAEIEKARAAAER